VALLFAAPEPFGRDVGGVSDGLRPGRIKSLNFLMMTASIVVRQGERSSRPR